MIELHISYNETTGDVNVSGPIGNKGLCYMMIECARDAVKDHVDKSRNTVPVTAPNNGVLPFIRKTIRKRR